MDKESKIMKVWGIRDRAHLSSQCEIDILTLLPNSNCSIHYHKKKTNKFIVIEGVVYIKTGFGEIKLEKEDRVTVESLLLHQFKTKNKPAILLEISFVTKGKIDNKDIIRKKQGCRNIKNKNYTVEELQRGDLFDNEI